MVYISLTDEALTPVYFSSPFQRIGFENELLKAREQCSDLEAELKVKVTSLETEIKALEKARKQDKKAAESSMVRHSVLLRSTGVRSEWPMCKRDCHYCDSMG